MRRVVSIIYAWPDGDTGKRELKNPDVVSIYEIDRGFAVNYMSGIQEKYIGLPYVATVEEDKA